MDSTNRNKKSVQLYRITDTSDKAQKVFHDLLSSKTCQECGSDDVTWKSDNDYYKRFECHSCGTVTHIEYPYRTC
jgi:tRNA G26 N,N-dimethylase Trm1